MILIDKFRKLFYFFKRKGSISSIATVVYHFCLYVSVLQKLCKGVVETYLYKDNVHVLILKNIQGE